MIAMVADPGVTEDRLPKPARRIPAPPVVLRVRTLPISRVLKRMRRGSQAENRFARVHEVHDVFHLAVRQLAEPQKHHHHIRAVELFQAGDVRLDVRINFTGVGIDREEDRASESMPLRQDLGQHRHAFLRAVFLVPGHEDDVLAFARANFPPVGDPFVRGYTGCLKCEQSESDQAGYGSGPIVRIHGGPSVLREMIPGKEKAPCRERMKADVDGRVTCPP